MISAIIIAKNEEWQIRSALESVSFCDELLVIDDGSTDGTVEIAKKFGARVFHRPLSNNYSSQRNWALKKAKGEWVLFLDADEMVGDVLSKSIYKATESDKYTAYKINRRDVFLGKKMNWGDGSQKIIRLMKKGEGEFAGKVHEVWKASGEVGILKGEMLHYSHPTVAEFLGKIGKYSQLHRGSARLPLLPVRYNFMFLPPVKFLHSYILKLGFLDGIRGFVYSVMMSLHSFLSWSNYYLIKK